MSIGGRIKQIRLENNLNQKTFSELLGVSQGTLSDIESGKSLPSYSTLESLSRVFRSDLNWLICDMKVSQEMNKSDANDFEVEMLRNYRKLDEIDKQEIAEYINIKIKLRGRTSVKP
jgi:DNA-binding XRE family transcriptional regulator